MIHRKTLWTTSKTSWNPLKTLWNTLNIVKHHKTLAIQCEDIVTESYDVMNTMLRELRLVTELLIMEIWVLFSNLVEDNGWYWKFYLTGNFRHVWKSIPWLRTYNDLTSTPWSIYLVLLPGVMGGLIAQAICPLWVSFAYHVHTFLVLIHYHLTALLMFLYIFQSNLFQHLK